MVFEKRKWQLAISSGATPQPQRARRNTKEGTNPTPNEAQSLKPTPIWDALG
jgi:hypothetical protein